MTDIKDAPPVQRFCPSCGAANAPESNICFACQQPLFGDAGKHAEQPFLLRDRYRILAELGSGGFGAVYKAEDTQVPHRTVAIKQINIGKLSAQEAIEATDTFNREVDVLSHLRHPRLPRIYDHFAITEHWHLVTDFIEGETLASYIERIARENTRAKDARLPLSEVLDMGLQLCDVLEYLHSRQPPVIFRDLKPSNIIRTPRGALYLIDFGTARYFTPGKAKDTIPFGSPGYAAPEQYGKAQTTPQADIYSLGAVLHELLSGIDPAETPFQFTPLRAYGGEGWSELEELLMRMVAMDVDKRPASVAEVKTALQQIARNGKTSSYTGRIWTPDLATSSPTQQSSFAGGQQQQQQQVTATPSAQTHTRPRSSRRRLIVGLGVVGALAAAGVPLYTWYRNTYRSQDHLLYTYRGHTSGPGRYHSVVTLAWSHDSTHIASGDASGMFRVWQATNGQEVFVQDLHSLVTSVSWSRIGSYIATGDRNGLVRLWNATNGRELTRPDDMGANFFSREIAAVAWSPMGDLIAAADSRGTLRVWNVNTLEGFLFNGEGIRTLDWSPDGLYLLVGGPLGVVAYQVAERPADGAITPRIVHQFDGTPFLSFGETMEDPAVWSPDGKWIAGVSETDNANDAVLIHWHQQEGTSYICPGPNTHLLISSLTWSPDSKYLAGAYGSEVPVWHVASKKIVYTYRGHDNDVRAVAWSPDGRLLASCDEDGVVQVWRADIPA